MKGLKSDIQTLDKDPLDILQDGSHVSLGPERFIWGSPCPQLSIESYMICIYTYMYIYIYTCVHTYVDMIDDDVHL